MKRFPIYEASGEVPRIADPLFTVGYGLSTNAINEDEIEVMLE